MFARIEVAVRPEFADPQGEGLLSRLRLALPHVAAKVAKIRYLDVYWFHFDAKEKEVGKAAMEIFGDPVLNRVFTLLPGTESAAEPSRIEEYFDGEGDVSAIERRFRPGVTDNVGKTAHEAFEIALGRKFPSGWVASGSLVLIEGKSLSQSDLDELAGGILCNGLIERWKVLSRAEISGDQRFDPEEVEKEYRRVAAWSAGGASHADAVAETYDFGSMDGPALEELSRKKLWALSREEMLVIARHFDRPVTDVEIEVIAQTWSEHCKHKLFGAKIVYSEDAGLPSWCRRLAPAGGILEVDGVFKTYVSGTTRKIERPWLLSVFSDNAGILAVDADHAVCIKVETHNTPSALDPYGGSLTGIVGVNRDILGCGLGAWPICNLDVFCLAAPDYGGAIPERLMHPRRILGGVRRGVEDGGNKSGIPTVAGALVFDDRYLGKPLIYCGTVGWMPRTIAGRPCESKEIRKGDRVCMVGGRIGKDGIHGATFSSLELGDESPVTAVQLGDPITQKRAADFLIEARDLGLYRALTDNGAGGLSSSVGELARITGGATIDVSRAKTKYPGLRPYELVVSESQERMTIAVPPERLDEFKRLAERRGVEVSDLGEFDDSGFFEVRMGSTVVAKLPLEFLHEGNPRLSLSARFAVPPPPPEHREASFANGWASVLAALLARPNIASKEWLIRQYDHEVQGMSVIKPLHQREPGGFSGPNDSGVLVLGAEAGRRVGIAVGCGLNPKLSDVDPVLMAASSVDEAVRNVLCTGGEYGGPERVMALVDNFCWPDPTQDAGKAAALVRAAAGMAEAALELGVPLVSGKDSMKNDFKGRLGEEEVRISVPPTLLMTAIARVSSIGNARTSDFKCPGDAIYLLGHGATVGALGLRGTEIEAWFREQGRELAVSDATTPILPGLPSWAVAKRVYAWIGGLDGARAARIASLHDVSDGGVLVAVAESLLARDLGADIRMFGDEWVTGFGEGFHSFILSCPSEAAQDFEAEWRAAKVPFAKLGKVTKSGELRVGESAVRVAELRQAWVREGYWE